MRFALGLKDFAILARPENPMLAESRGETHISSPVELTALITNPVGAFSLLISSFSCSIRRLD
jgi:hypothetical protein